MKNLVNLIALVMLVSVNILTPFSYAQENPELEMEANTLESNETGNGIQTDNILDESNQNTNIGLDGDEKIGSNIEEQKGTLDENNGEGEIDISGVQPKKLGIKGNLGGINLMSINQEDPVQIVRDGEIVSTYTGLSQAINETESGDVINLMEDILVIEASVIAGKSLTINGNNHTITRNADITTITVNEDSSLKLIDITITDNAVNFAPNRYKSLLNNKITISLCPGGVVETMNESGDVISSECATENVDVAKANPQIYSVGDIYGDNLTISNSLNSQGSAAIIVEKGGIEMVNSSFIHNGTSKKGRGGAIRVGPNTAVNIVDESPITKMIFSGCNFESNYGVEQGGAIAIHYAPEIMTIDNCIFSGNTAYENGGAIHIPNIRDRDPSGSLPVVSSSEFPVGTLYITNSKFYNNWCGNDGAAIENDDLHLEISNTYFEHNYGMDPNGGNSVGVISCQAGGESNINGRGRGLVRRNYTINNSIFKDTNTIVLGDHQTFGSYIVDSCYFEKQMMVIYSYNLRGKVKNSTIKNSNPFGYCGKRGRMIWDIDIVDYSNGVYLNDFVPIFGESTFELENNTYINDCTTNEYFPIRNIDFIIGNHNIIVENDSGVRIFIRKDRYDSVNIQGTDEIYYGATIDDGKFAYIKKNKFYNFEEFNDELNNFSYSNSGYQLESGKTMLFYLDSGYTELWSGSISTTTNLYGKETDIYNIIYEGMEGVDFEGITHTYKFNNLNHAQYLTELTPYILNTPSTHGHKFLGWYLDSEYTIPVTSIETGSTGDITLYAKWERTENEGYSGGGSRGGSSKDDISNDGEKSTEQSTGNQEDPSISSQNDDDVSSGVNVENSENTTQKDSSTVSENDGKIYSPEFQQAYEFAKKNGITTKSTIKESKMDGKLTRIEMAKMLSYYAINVMGKTPDTTKNVKFRDVTKKMDEKYDNGVTLAYQLGIMGINMSDNKFRPNDLVTRAEFVTALSRMLYQTSDGEYEKTAKYYIPHMAKLYNEGIVNDTNPGMKERRGYVMIMLMRAVK